MTLKNFDELLNKYADLTVQVGVDVKKNDTVVIQIDVEQYKFARLLVEKAYSLGAAEVLVQWSDDPITKMTLQSADFDRITTFKDYRKEQINYWLKNKAKRISVMSSDPAALDGVSAKRLAAMQKTNAAGAKKLRAATSNNDVSWTIVAVPSLGWAKKVFPESPDNEAIDKLWDEIFKTTRIYEDNPVEAWHKHDKRLQEKADELNTYQFELLHYWAPGTDIQIGLPDNHIWQSAGAINANKEYFMPNMPTEEVFTSPDFRRINGYISSTKPLSYGGQLIEGIKLTFKDGKIVEASADKGEETIKHLIETDEGSHSLGEVSLVPESSPISQSGITFFNTLFDENASNHIAIGSAYPFTVKDGTQMNEEQLKKIGMNVSNVHVDFMVGSKEMNIDGITEDGKQIPVFRNGEWI